MGPSRPNPSGGWGLRAISLSFVVNDASASPPPLFATSPRNSHPQTLPYLWTGVLSLQHPLNLTGIGPVTEELRSFQRSHGDVVLVGFQKFGRLADVHLLNLEMEAALEFSQDLKAFRTELASRSSKEFDLNAIHCCFKIALCLFVNNSSWPHWFCYCAPIRARCLWQPGGSRTRPLNPSRSGTKRPILN